MKIVKPTQPPSMAVWVDTIFYGDYTIPIEPADIDKDRVDVIYAMQVHRFDLTRNPYIDVMKGPSIGDYPTNNREWPIPTVPKHARVIAKIYIHRSQTAIYQPSILEF